MSNLEQTTQEMLSYQEYELEINKLLNKISDLKAREGYYEDYIKENKDTDNFLKWLNNHTDRPTDIFSSNI